MSDRCGDPIPHGARGFGGIVGFAFLLNPAAADEPQIRAAVCVGFGLIEKRPRSRANGFGVGFARKIETKLLHRSMALECLLRDT